MAARTTPAGEIIAGLRRERGITQEKLAELTDLDTRTIQRLEAGDSISPDTITVVAKALGVGAASLFGPRSLTALVDLAEDMTCHYCGARVVERGSGEYMNVDFDYE